MHGITWGGQGKSPTLGKCEEKFWKRQGKKGDEYSAGSEMERGGKGREKRKDKRKGKGKEEKEGEKRVEKGGKEKLKI